MRLGRWSPWLLIALWPAGCAGLDGYRDSQGTYQYRDRQQALQDQVDTYNDWFSDKTHPPFGQY